MTEAEERARFKVSKLSDDMLMKQWNLTSMMRISPELAMVRGWLMDEIQERFPKGFDKWLSSEMMYDNELKYYIQGEMSRRKRECRS